jgi:protein-tyrosine-phosphatase/predicted ATP-grasp superfamily ATP-dependent carboligase
MSSTGRVLVLGEDNRSCLTVVRSLGRRRINVLLGTQSADSVVPRSRYIDRAFVMPSTKGKPDAFLGALQTILEKEPVDLVIPCSDRTLVPIAQHRSDLENLGQLAIPDELGFRYSYLKDKTLELAQSLGAPFPRSILVDGVGALEENRFFWADRFPIVVKPVSSKVWKDGKRYELRTRMAADWQSLSALVRDLTAKAPVLLQEYFQGIGVGQEFLVNQGAIVRAFQHERVHEPLRGGGGSSYRKSVQVDEDLLFHSRRMLSQLRWTGVAMVEYRRNTQTGEFTLMEINGRFWGSLPLAVAAGADFPYWLYQLHTGEELASEVPYTIGIHGRNVMSDLGWFIEQGGRERSKWTTAVFLAKEVASGLRNCLSGKERWDEITQDDPMPGLVELGYNFRRAARRATLSTRRRILTLLSSVPTWQQAQKTRVRRLLDTKPRLLFVCRGNICRSPFAEAYVKHTLNRLGTLDIAVESAGTFPEAGREPPDLARLVSREYDISLEGHRSRTIDPVMIDQAGAVVCMDFRDYADLTKGFPSVSGKLFFLRPFDSPGRDLEIRDPWEKPASEFQSCYAQIKSSTDRLIEAVVGGASAAHL